MRPARGSCLYRDDPAATTERALAGRRQPRPVSTPDADPGPPADRLALRRLAARGFGVGAAVAVVVFVTFALVPGTTRPLALYVGLAAVLGVSVGLLAALGLVALRAVRLAREL